MTVSGRDGRGARFEVATGAACAPADSTEERAAAVRAAFEGLRQIRHTVNAEALDPVAVPAEWERRQPVRAIALALEAAGIPPSALNTEGTRIATGYCVRTTERPGAARVEWLGPRGSGAQYEEQQALNRCATALRELGWEALMYRGPGRRHYLEVEPAP